MNCAHGFPAETCPHCQMQMKIKPPTQLVKPAAREIPTPVPSRDNIHNVKDMQYTPLVNQQKTISHMPQRLSRNLDLGMSISNGPSSLFEERSQILQERTDPKGLIKDQLKELSIVDLRKRFSEK